MISSLLRIIIVLCNFSIYLSQVKNDVNDKVCKINDEEFTSTPKYLLIGITDYEIHLDLTNRIFRDNIKQISEKSNLLQLDTKTDFKAGLNFKNCNSDIGLKENGFLDKNKVAKIGLGDLPMMDSPPSTPNPNEDLPDTQKKSKNDPNLKTGDSESKIDNVIGDKIPTIDTNKKTELNGLNRLSVEDWKNYYLENISSSEWFESFTYEDKLFGVHYKYEKNTELPLDGQKNYQEYQLNKKTIYKQLRIVKAKNYHTGQYYDIECNHLRLISYLGWARICAEVVIYDYQYKNKDEKCKKVKINIEIQPVKKVDSPYDNPFETIIRIRKSFVVPTNYKKFGKHINIGNLEFKFLPGAHHNQGNNGKFYEMLIWFKKTYLLFNARYLIDKKNHRVRNLTINQVCLQKTEKGKCKTHRISNIYYLKNQMLLYEFYRNKSFQLNDAGFDKKQFIENSKLSSFTGKLTIEGQRKYYYQAFNAGDTYYKKPTSKDPRFRVKNTKIMHKIFKNTFFSTAFIDQNDGKLILEFKSKCDQDNLYDFSFTKNALVTSSMWGGQCRCKFTGAEFWVSDNNDSCGSLDCLGGDIVGECNHFFKSKWANKGVICITSDKVENIRKTCIEDSITRIKMNHRFKKRYDFDIIMDQKDTHGTKYSLYETRNFNQVVKKTTLPLKLDGYSLANWPHFVLEISSKTIHDVNQYIPVLTIHYDINLSEDNSFIKPVAIQPNTHDNLIFLRKANAAYVIPLQSNKVILKNNFFHQLLYFKNQQKDSMAKETGKANIKHRHSAKKEYRKDIKEKMKESGMQKSYINLSKKDSKTSSLIQKQNFIIEYVPYHDKIKDRCGMTHINGRNYITGTEIKLKTDDICKGGIVKLNSNQINNDPMVKIDFFNKFDFDIFASKKLEQIQGFITYDRNYQIKNFTMVVKSNENTLYNLHKDNNGHTYFKKYGVLPDFRSIKYMHRIGNNHVILGIEGLNYQLNLTDSSVISASNNDNYCENMIPMLHSDFGRSFICVNNNQLWLESYAQNTGLLTYKKKIQSQGSDKPNLYDYKYHLTSETYSDFLFLVKFSQNENVNLVKQEKGSIGYHILNIKGGLQNHSETMIKSTFTLSKIIKILDQIIVDGYLLIAGYKDKQNSIRKRSYIIEVWVQNFSYEFEFSQYIDFNKKNVKLSFDINKFKFFKHISSEAGETKNHVVFDFIVEEKKKKNHNLGLYKPGLPIQNAFSYITLPEGELVIWGTQSHFINNRDENKLVIFTKTKEQKDKKIIFERAKRMGITRSNLNRDDVLYKVRTTLIPKPYIKFDIIQKVEDVFKQSDVKQLRLRFRGLKMIFPDNVDLKDNYSHYFNLIEPRTYNGYFEKSSVIHPPKNQRNLQAVPNSNAEKNHDLNLHINNKKTTGKKKAKDPSDIKIDLNLGLLTEKAAPTLSFDVFTNYKRNYTYVIEPKQYFEVPVYKFDYEIESRIENITKAINVLPMIRSFTNLTQLPEMVPSKDFKVDYNSHSNQIFVKCSEYSNSYSVKNEYLNQFSKHKSFINVNKECLQIWISSATLNYIDGILLTNIVKDEHDADIIQKTVVRTRADYKEHKKFLCTGPVIFFSNRIYLCQKQNIQDKMDTFLSVKGFDGKFVSLPDINYKIDNSKSKIKVQGSMLFVFIYNSVSQKYLNVHIFERVNTIKSFHCRNQNISLDEYKQCISKAEKDMKKHGILFKHSDTNIYLRKIFAFNAVKMSVIQLNTEKVSEFVLKLEKNQVLPKNDIEKKDVEYNTFSLSRKFQNIYSYNKYLIGTVSMLIEQNEWLILEINAFEAIKKGLEDFPQTIHWDYSIPKILKKVRLQRIDQLDSKYLMNDPKISTILKENNDDLGKILKIVIMFPNSRDFYIEIPYEQIISANEEYIPLEKLKLISFMNEFYGLKPLYSLDPLLTDKSYITFRKYKCENHVANKETKNKGYFQIYDVRTKKVVKKQQKLKNTNVVYSTKYTNFEGDNLGLSKKYQATTQLFDFENNMNAQEGPKTFTSSTIPPYAIKNVPNILTFSVFEEVYNLSSPNEFMLIALDDQQNVYSYSFSPTIDLIIDNINIVTNQINFWIESVNNEFYMGIIRLHHDQLHLLMRYQYLIDITIIIAVGLVVAIFLNYLLGVQKDVQLSHIKKSHKDTFDTKPNKQDVFGSMLNKTQKYEVDGKKEDMDLADCVNQSPKTLPDDIEKEISKDLIENYEISRDLEIKTEKNINK